MRKSSCKDISRLIFSIVIRNFESLWQLLLESRDDQYHDALFVQSTGLRWQSFQHLTFHKKWSLLVVEGRFVPFAGNVDKILQEMNCCHYLQQYIRLSFYGLLETCFCLSGL